MPLANFSLLDPNQPEEAPSLEKTSLLCHRLSASLILVREQLTYSV